MLVSTKVVWGWKTWTVRKVKGDTLGLARPGFKRLHWVNQADVRPVNGYRAGKVIHWLMKMPSVKRRKEKYACGRVVRQYSYTLKPENLTCKGCLRVINKKEAA